MFVEVKDFKVYNNFDLSKAEFLLFNGPPQSGKDVSVNILKRCLNKYHEDIEFKYDTSKFFNHVSFRKQVENIVITVYNIDPIEWHYRYTNGLKDTPWERLHGKTQRQALIYISEVVIKPNYGKEYFGKLAIPKLRPCLNLFSDSGFKEELEIVINEVCIPNNKIVKVIRLHRENYTYERFNDSRDYIHKEMFTEEQQKHLDFLDVYAEEDNLPSFIDQMYTLYTELEYI